MILRKPYAFIIRHFRLIHIVMLIMLVYAFIDLNSVNTLFANLQSTNTYTFANAMIYADNLAYWACLVLAAMSGIIFFLFKEKKKPTNLYLGIVIYSIILLIGFSLLYGQLAELQERLFEDDEIILVKDISFLLSLPIYAFIPLCFIRGIGFNIKKFNFSKDIKELEIAGEDSEEFEVMVGQNNYKYFRAIRRTIRETKYFILENKFLLSVFTGIVVVILSGVGIYYYDAYMKKFSEAEVISVNQISYIVNKSYITEKDFNGDYIKDGYKYVVVDMAFHNVSRESKSLNLDMITLTNGKIIYYPTLNMNSKFYDLGAPYKAKQEIGPDEMIEATLAFEIPVGVSARNFTLKVQYQIDETFDDVVMRYKNFNVSALDIDNDEFIKEVKVNDLISVNVVGKNKVNLAVTGYKLQDTYENKYVTCKDLNNCTAFTTLIKTNNNVAFTMLAVDFNLDVDDNAQILKTFNTTNKIFNNYAMVRYVTFNKEYIVPAKIVPNSDVKNKVFFEVPRNITDASSIDLIVDFRDEKFEIALKEKAKSV